MSRPFIACCIIVKNAERTFGALLQDLKGSFDELVIVDTGSTDRTREITVGALLDFNALELQSRDPEKVAAWWAGAKDKEHATFETTNGRVVLARFDWIKDFAAARNFSFSLATAEWRGYFDADDRVPDAKHLRKTLAALQQRNPSANTLVLSYDYVPGEVRQEVSRFFRLDEGEEWGGAHSWRWEDEIHEFVTGKQKHMVSISAKAFVVTQDKIEEEHFRSRMRNREILLDAYEKAPRGSQKRGRHAFHLAQDLTFQLEPAAATELFLETASCLEHSSLGASALTAAARIAQSSGDLAGAMALAGRAAGEYPMLSEPLALLGILNTVRGAYDVAASHFDRAFKLPPLPRRTIIDRIFDEGLVPAHAALAYAFLGRVDDAMAQLKKVPVPFYYEKQVRPVFYTAQEITTRLYGERLLTQLVDFYLWDTESLKALDFLGNFVPAALADQSIVHQLRAKVEAKIPHMKDWTAYQRYYSEVPREIFFEARENEDREKVRGTARAQRLLAWGASLPLEGPPVHVLAIGSNDASIEEGLLIINPRIRLTLADAAVQTSEILLQLQAKYGADRVRGHDVKLDHYDWCPRELKASFDAVVLFEVLEHVPDEREALQELHNALLPGGVAFVSTPNARRWVEPYLTGAADYFPEGDVRRQYGEAHLFWHVRANNPKSIAKLFLSAGFDPDIVTGDHEGNLIVQATRNLIAAPRKRIAIFAAGARPSFDSESVKTGFLGGSETAVVYLSEALARAGFEVTAFTEKLLRPELNSMKICRRNGVVWRDTAEFHPATPEFDTVLYWRCPYLLSLPEYKAAKHKKVLWLHDCAHQMGKLGYDGADEVLVLSESHAKSIAKYDGYTGPVTFIDNGLNPESFPAFDEPRDPKKALYVSSPDRGLERLLAWWPDVRAQVPDATLDIYYSWTEARKKNPELIGRLEKKLEELQDLGVVYRGGVPQPELHRAMRTAGVWAYPTSGDAETFCISLTSALASGCWPVVSDAGALRETAGEYAGLCVVDNCNDETIDTPEGKERFITALVTALNLTAEASTATRQAMRQWALETYSWDKVAEGFIPAL